MECQKAGWISLSVCWNHPLLRLSLRKKKSKDGVSHCENQWLNSDCMRERRKKGERHICNIYHQAVSLCNMLTQVHKLREFQSNCAFHGAYGSVKQTCRQCRKKQCPSNIYSNIFILSFLPLYSFLLPSFKTKIVFFF